MEWVIHKYYYIINFKYFTRPRIYPVYFTNKAAAKRAISQNIKSLKERAYYEIIQGKKLVDFECTYVLRLGRLGEFTKYNYPEYLETIQQRKSYRTLMRRRLRRMGMLTDVQNKYRIGEKGKRTQLIHNTQKVADSPTTRSVGFRLERKNKNVYYIIKDKKISKKKGILFELKAWKLDIKKKTVGLISLKIQRKDVIIPYLITEISKKYNDLKLSINRFAKGSVKIHKGEKERFLKVLQDGMA